MQTLYKLLQDICKPDPKTTNDPITLQFLWKRNIFTLGMLTTLNIANFSSLAFFTFSRDFNITYLGTNLFLWAFFIVTCRAHLQVFTITYTIFFSVFAFDYMKSFGPEMVFVYFGYAFVQPPFIFVLSNNVFLTTISGIAQVINLKYRYRRLFIEALDSMGSEEFSEKFIAATLGLYGLMVISYILIMKYLNKTTLEHMKSQKDLEEALEQQKTFVFSFSHELRNPLNSLLGNLQLILMSQIPLETKKMVNTAQICAEVLLQLVNNILDIGKHDLGKLEIDPLPNKIHNSFRRIWKISSEQISQKKTQGLTSR